MGKTHQKKKYRGLDEETSGKQKLYEAMLSKEATGTQHQPLQAVLESSLEYDKYCGVKGSSIVRNHALLHYIASLASSNSPNDAFDYDFVQFLVDNGADINCPDKSGQTIFHEVARSWNLDVASFLIEIGADLNKQDTFGRSPLHVASAMDYAKMVEFLIKKGGTIDIKTFGEEQMPIHFAAKNGACKSLKMLLGYGANIASRDAKQRTPLQVAAEMNRLNTASLLIQHGAPACVTDNRGDSALSLLIEKVPAAAVEALDQFHSISIIDRKEYFYLNYLENLDESSSPAFSALEIAVQNSDYNIILHPVVQRLIYIKWLKFGKLGATRDLVLNLLYAVLWTVYAVTTPAHGNVLYETSSSNIWRIIISVVIFLLTIDEIRKQITGIVKARRRQKRWIEWRVDGLKEDLKYCHPRWPQEDIYLKSQITSIEDTPMISTSNSWLYIDWFCLLLIVVTIASLAAYVKLDTPFTHMIYLRVLTLLLLVLWIRILKYARPFEGAGPFVVIFGHIVWNIFSWCMTVGVIGVPFTCAFWISFGYFSSTPVVSYSSFESLNYNMFSMLVLSDFHFEELEAADPVMSKLLCGFFIAISSIVCLNLLIALLSDTFTRVHRNAIAHSVMQRASTILVLQRSLSARSNRAYKDFIETNCSPNVITLRRDSHGNASQKKKIYSLQMKTALKEAHAIVFERLGKQFGKDKMSDFDYMKQTIVKIIKERERCDRAMYRLEKHLKRMQDVAIKLCERYNIDYKEPIPCSTTEESGDEAEGGVQKPQATTGFSLEQSDTVQAALTPCVTAIARASLQHLQNPLEPVSRTHLWVDELDRYNSGTRENQPADTTTHTQRKTHSKTNSVPI